MVGLQAYLRPLNRIAKGGSRQLNSDLRAIAKPIAMSVAVLVEAAVESSAAPQAHALAGTVRVHSDRVPVVVVGKVNPRFTTPWRRPTRSGPQRKRDRGAMAMGVLQGGKGGHPDTRASENYYRIPRNETLGVLGEELARDGRIMRRAQRLYLKGLQDVMVKHGYPPDQLFTLAGGD